MREEQPPRGAPTPPDEDFGGGGDALRARLNLNPIPAADEELIIVVEDPTLNHPMRQLLGIIPGQNALDISPAMDGKLWKEVLYSPVNRSGPEDYGAGTGMECKVHYRGTLVDGSVFDFNDETDPPFTFTLGESAVIQGWEKGVPGMKRGDVIKLICHADFAYGDKGNNDIPPNSTLIFEITMVDYSPEDLTKNKNGHILRYNIKQGGSKYLNPNHNSMVEVTIRGKYKERDIEVYPSRTEKFRLGEGCEHGIPYGVEKALYKFRSGEGSILIIKGQKYGIPAADYAKHGISPETPLEFYVELLSHENIKEPWQLSGPEKLEIARDLKELGNKFFAKSNYRVACRNYKLIIDHLKAEALLVGDEEEERKRLLLAAYLNMAICNLKSDKPTVAIRNCDDALALDSKSSKAYFRRGLANFQVNLPDFAKLDFEKVLELEPTNAAASQHLVACIKKMKENLKQEKSMYTKMFSVTGSKSETPLSDAMKNVSEWDDKKKPSEANGTKTS